MYNMHQKRRKKNKRNETTDRITEYMLWFAYLSTDIRKNATNVDKSNEEYEDTIKSELQSLSNNTLRIRKKLTQSLTHSLSR